MMSWYKTNSVWTRTGSMLPLVICCVLVGTSVAQVDPVSTTEAALVSQIQALEAKLLTLDEKVKALEESKDVNLMKRSLFDFPHHRQLRDRVLIGGPSNIYASEPVAMYVSLTKTTTVPENGLVPYSQTYTAGGLTSIPKSASFEIPRDCYCLISITVLANESHLAILELKRNHRNVFKAWSDNRKGTHTQGGGSVVLRLQQGDRLEVRSRYETELRGDDVNTFSVLCYGGPLFKGDIEDYNGRCHVMCPWHSYMFDLETGMNEIGLRQKVFPVKYEDGAIYVRYHTPLSLETTRKVSNVIQPPQARAVTNKVTRKDSVLETPMSL